MPLAGQHDELARGLDSGWERSKGGKSLAFLVNMHWKPKHILLASCNAIVEAAAIYLGSPHAIIYCLPSDVTMQSETDTGRRPAWHKGLMQMDVRPVEVPRQPTHNTEATSDLSISWRHAMQDAIPAAPDMIVIPAEGEGAIQAVGSMLLHESHIIVSQHLISYLSQETAEELAAAPTHGQAFLHMHLSGWELYARETVVLSEQRTQLPRPAQRRIKIAYHVTAIGRYPAIVQEHFGRLIFSGLYDVVERIYCFILGPSTADIEQARMLLQRFGRKVFIAGTLTNTTQYERFTLLGIRAYLQPGDTFLYMHSKGLRYKPSDQNMYDWSFYMMYFLVKRYPLCLRLLSKDFDICGVDFISTLWKLDTKVDAPHFSGNFFWATAEYYLSLPNYIGEGYLDPELYVSSGSPRHVALWDAHVNFHTSEYPPLRFVDTARIASAWQGILSHR